MFNEINSIDKTEISSDLFIYPNIQKKQDSYYNLANYNKFKIYPVMAIRYGNSGFEMSEDNSIQTFWVSPGIDIRFNQLLIKLETGSMRDKANASYRMNTIFFNDPAKYNSSYRNRIIKIHNMSKSEH